MAESGGQRVGIVFLSSPLLALCSQPYALCYNEEVM